MILQKSQITLISSEQARNGFTLIEILVALVVVAVTAAVILESQLVSLKAERKARALQELSFEVGRVHAAACRLTNEQALAQWMETNSACKVKSEKVTVESGTNVLIYLKHELSPAIAPEFTSVFYTRLGEDRPHQPESGAGPVDPRGKAAGQ
ncbi:MAG: prepilin-type N-terminal cleavage/methylation domain-containing protein [Kiritimatiellia bacterium]